MPDAALLAILPIVATIAAVWFVRTPKEAVRELEVRIAAVEGALNAMAKDYAGNHARHDQALITLTAAINKLTDRFDAYMGNGHGGNRRG